MVPRVLSVFVINDDTAVQHLILHNRVLIHLNLPLGDQQQHLCSVATAGKVTGCFQSLGREDSMHPGNVSGDFESVAGTPSAEQTGEFHCLVPASMIPPFD